MKTQKHTSWDDVLFENRNKAYGAYDLRKNENLNLLKSLFTGLLFIGIAVAALSFTGKDETPTDPGFSCPVIIDLSDFDNPPLAPEKPSTTPEAPSIPVKPDKNAIPDPVDSPETETPVSDNKDLGTIIMPGGTDASNDGSIQSGTASTGGSVNENSGADTTGPAETKINYLARDVAYMAVFPGCEKFGNDKEKSQECFARKLQGELGIQLSDFRETAEAYNIHKAAAKLQFVVDKSGKIVQVKAMNGGNATLSKESKEAMERISKKFIQKGKLIQPAKLDDGTPVNVVFTIPVKFTSN